MHRFNTQAHPRSQNAFPKAKTLLKKKAHSQKLSGQQRNYRGSMPQLQHLTNSNTALHVTALTHSYDCRTVQCSLTQGSILVPVLVI